MEQITITGGAGFIGSNLVNHYLNKGLRVIVYDTLERKGCINNVGWLRRHEKSHNLEILVGDVRLPSEDLRAAIEESDAILHLAGQVAVTTSVRDPVHDFEVNALGTMKLLELVRKSPRKQPVFAYASTNKVYGSMEDVRIIEGDDRYTYADLSNGVSEDRRLDFHSPYGCSKGSADQYVHDYGRIYGLRTVVFRQSCIYGYRQFGLEDQGWVAWFVIAALLNLPIVIYGNGKQVRDVLFIDDLLDVYEAALDQIDTTSGHIFNIGGGPQNAICLLDLIELLKDKVNPSLQVSYSDWRPGDQPVYVSDISKAHALVHWEPKVDWRSGVERLIDWVKDNQGMFERMFISDSAASAGRALGVPHVLDQQRAVRPSTDVRAR